MKEIRRYEMLIDGDWVGASDGALFDSLNPATGEVWSQVPEATTDDVYRAVRAAHCAFTSGPWALMTPTEPGRCLRNLTDLLAEKSEDLGRTETIDTGKMLKETRWQAKYIAEFFHFYAGYAEAGSDTFDVFRRFSVAPVGFDKFLDVRVEFQFGFAFIPSAIERVKSHRVPL